MLKTLLKKQMAEIFRNYFYDPKKNKMRSKGATIAYIALYALLMVGLLGGMFALMAVGLCGPLVEAGMDWLYYLLMGLIAVLLGTFAVCSARIRACICPKTTTCCCRCRSRCAA